MYKIANILIFVFLSLRSYAQQTDTSVFKYPIEMDAVVISAARSGWDVKGFIKRVQTDTTFFKAFRSLHVVSFKATNDIKVIDKRGGIDASLYSHTQQSAVNHCRTMKVLDEKVTGDMYKRNGEFNYYTAELYAYLFFTKGKVCDEDDIVAGRLDDKGKGKLEKSKWQLKQLIFNPGAPVSGIPFIGDKANIFDEDVAKYYDFKLLSDTYGDEDCYVFKIDPKKGDEDKVVYNELTTWFRKTDYSIVARDYSLSYHTLLYDFDVRMKVRTTQVNKRLLPSQIDYDGNWHVFSKKREHVKFTIIFKY